MKEVFSIPVRAGKEKRPIQCQPGLFYSQLKQLPCAVTGTPPPPPTLPASAEPIPQKELCQLTTYGQSWMMTIVIISSEDCIISSREKHLTILISPNRRLSLSSYMPDIPFYSKVLL